MCTSIAAVLPAYNAAGTIEFALNSVLAQDPPPKEIIVVNDGSTDSTSRILSQFRSIRVIDQRNQGSAVARQAGTDAATSDYIAYLDADDWWPHGKLAAIHRILKQEPVDFLLSDLQRAYPGDPPEHHLPRNSTFFPWVNEYLGNAEASTKVANLFRLDSSRALEVLLRGFPVFPSTMVVRAAAVNAVGGWDARFRRCQDFDMGLRLSRSFPLFYLNEVQAILGLHRGNDDGLAYVVKQTRGDLQVLLAHHASEPESSIYRHQVARAVAGKYCNLGYALRQQENWASAKTAYANALAWPGRKTHALTRWLMLSCRLD